MSSSTGFPSLPHPAAAQQAHLLHGVNFMAPFVNNDHSIHYPVPDATYVRYGPLFAQLRALQWVLAPHAVSVTPRDGAEANFFHTRFGYAAPVVFPKQGLRHVALTLRGVRNATSAADAARAHGAASAGLAVSLLYPDGAPPKSTTAFEVAADGSLSLSVPLGGDARAPCAMVLIRDALRAPLEHPGPRQY